MLSCTFSMFWTTVTSQTSSEKRRTNRHTVKPTVMFGSRAGFAKGSHTLPCFRNLFHVYSQGFCSQTKPVVAMTTLALGIAPEQSAWQDHTWCWQTQKDPAGGLSQMYLLNGGSRVCCKKSIWGIGLDGNRPHDTHDFKCSVTSACKCLPDC